MRKTPILSYEESTVPAQFSPFIRRMLCAQLQPSQSVTVPARPTGFTYLGWLAQGGSVATANGETFNFTAGMVHFSGQLTTFDAEYSLKGPAVHYLAELRGDAAFAILDRDIGALRNRVLVLDEFSKAAPSLAAFEAILGKLIQNGTTTVPPEITEALHRIETKNGAISIADLARDLGVSDRQLRRQFLRIVGMPPKSFAVCQRILAALKLLATHPDMPITDVVYDMGFTDQSHLTKIFKQYMRTTPAKLELDQDGVLRSIVSRV